MILIPLFFIGGAFVLIIILRVLEIKQEKREKEMVAKMRYSRFLERAKGAAARVEQISSKFNKVQFLNDLY